MALSAVASPTTQPIQWGAWDGDVFTRSKAQHKLVILDLHAVWCHWCHVMDETTYRDPAVVKLLADHYLPIGVDADSRPDLANRYEDYGWPATIIFDENGKELAKRRGYLPPEQMASLLKACVDDPTPGPSVRAEAAVQSAASAALSTETRAKLIKQLKNAFDAEHTGWGTTHRFIEADVIDFCLTSGDAELAGMATKTLRAGEKLIDPAWGGVYQYSTDGDWDHPHFEKIMSYQADDLRAYSHASILQHNPADLSAATAIRSYLRNFLTSPDGAFYTSQDADLVPGEHSGEYFALDDAGRRKLGVPRIDKHIYSRENGWAITGLVAYYTASGDATALADATRAAEWIVAHRAIAGGGFSHDEKDAAGPFLGDTLAMGRACLALYSVTADRKWLTRAVDAADFIGVKFGSAAGSVTGMVTVANDPAAKPQVDENVQLARFANLLYAYTGKKEHRATAEVAMKYVASPQVLAGRNWLVGGILLADQELASEPLHVTIVGAKSDPAAQKLFAAALPIGIDYARREWFDRAEGPLSRPDVDYPTLPKPAAFLCTNGTCSRPMMTAESFGKLVASKQQVEAK